MLSHKNVVASASGLLNMGVDLVSSDSYLSYLPLAHSFETVMQILATAGGGSIGFYQGNVKLLTDDIMALRPTIFAGVPRVYSRIYDKVRQALRVCGERQYQPCATGVTVVVLATMSPGQCCGSPLRQFW